MSDFIYCLSNPAEPGLIRLSARRSSHDHHSGNSLRPVCRTGEQVEWSLKVCDAGMTLSALHRSMRRYRKNRGRGVYRCSAMDAREVAVRYTTLRPSHWGLSSNEVRDDVLATMLIIAFGLSVFFSQAAQLGTGKTLGITATVLTALTIGIAYFRLERGQTR